MASQFSLVREPFTVLKLPFDSSLNYPDPKKILTELKKLKKEETI